MVAMKMTVAAAIIRNFLVILYLGVFISKLNEEILPQFNMALSNQGSLSEQTVAGMISTGSHGTGVAFGAFSSCVLAITFMTADGMVL